MGPALRKTLAVLGTLGFHTGLLLWGAFGPSPELDLDIDIELEEVELLDPDAIQAEAPPPPEPPPPVVAPPPVTEPTPVDPAAEEKQKAEEEKKKEEPPPEPKRDLGKKATQVDRLGPTNSTFYMLLVPKKIRSLSFGDKARDVMAPLPDYQYLVAGGGLDPLTDFDHLVIASPNITDWTQTFLAVDYKMSREKMKAAIEQAVAASGEVIEWIEEDGVLRGNPRPANESDEDVDPRWFVLLEDKIAVYVREEFLPHVLGDEESADAPTAGGYVANLTKLRRFASRQPTSGMQIVIKDIRAAVKQSRGFKFQLPDRLEVSVEATEEPEVLVRMEWPDVVEAKAFELFWRDDIPRVIDRYKVPLVFNPKSYYDQIEVSQDAGKVDLWARFDTGQASTILDLVAQQSAKIAGKTPEELAEQRRRRIEKLREKRAAQRDSETKGASEGGGKPIRDPERRSPGDAPPPVEPSKTPSDDATPPASDGPARDTGASPPQ